LKSQRFGLEPLVAVTVVPNPPTPPVELEHFAVPVLYDQQVVSYITPHVFNPTGGPLPSFEHHTQIFQQWFNTWTETTQVGTPEIWGTISFQLATDHPMRNVTAALANTPDKVVVLDANTAAALAEAALYASRHLADGWGLVWGQPGHTNRLHQYGYTHPDIKLNATHLLGADPLGGFRLKTPKTTVAVTGWEHHRDTTATIFGVDNQPVYVCDPTEATQLSKIGAGAIRVWVQTFTAEHIARLATVGLDVEPGHQIVIHPQHF